jgi:hypothetical protein
MPVIICTFGTGSLFMRKFFAHRAIRREIQQNPRNRAFVGLSQAHTIGILAKFTGKEDFELLKKYVAYVKEYGKKIKCMVFSEGKAIPEDISWSKVEFEFFLGTDLNWYGKPGGVYLNNFKEEAFDVLLDLNLGSDICLSFLAAGSRATFKIGPSGSLNREYLDMCIEFTSPDRYLL